MFAILIVEGTSRSRQCSCRHSTIMFERWQGWSCYEQSKTLYLHHPHSLHPLWFLQALDEHHAQVDDAIYRNYHSYQTIKTNTGRDSARRLTNTNSIPSSRVNSARQWMINLTSDKSSKSYFVAMPCKKRTNDLVRGEADRAGRVRVLMGVRGGHKEPSNRRNNITITSTSIVASLNICILSWINNLIQF